MKKIIRRTKGFEKNFKKLPKSAKSSFINKLELFIDDEFTPSLKTHRLKGARKSHWSFSVTSDIRAIYKKQIKKEKTVITFTFIDIGTYNKVY